MPLANKYIQYSVLFFLALEIFSCQPKDADLRALAASVKTNQNNTNTSVPPVMEMTDAETNTVFALSLDRMAESVFLMKAVLSPEFAAAHFLNLRQEANVESSDELPDTFLESVTLVPQLDPLSQQTEVLQKMNTIALLNYKVDELSIDVSGKLRKLVLVKNIFKSVTAKGDLNTKKGDFSIKNISDRISVRLTADENIYLIKISRVDETSSKSDKNTTLNYEAKFKLAWSGDIAGLNSEMSISNISMRVDRLGAKTGQMNFANNQQNLTLKVGQCVSLNGRLSLSTSLSHSEQKMTNPTELVVTDSTFEIPNLKFKSMAQPCEVRPVVDLTRMLN